MGKFRRAVPQGRHKLKESVYPNVSLFAQYQPGDDWEVLLVRRPRLELPRRLPVLAFGLVTVFHPAVPGRVEVGAVELSPHDEFGLPSSDDEPIYGGVQRRVQKQLDN